MVDFANSLDFFIVGLQKVSHNFLLNFHQQLDECVVIFD
ncbi:hypothetical protein T06_4110 [Trichinella sp. T6]|nr:hypothetical protein T06_4110 [Trichinella sp. T6]